MTKLENMINEFCPDGVEFVKLNKICYICDGTHQTPEYTSSGVKFVSVENINNLYGTDKYISETDYNKYKVKPQINDVLMTRIGSVGVCAVIDRDIPLAYYVSLALLRPDNNIILSKYLKYVIESKYGRKELDKRTLIYAVPIKVNTGDIGKITIPMPPIEVQHEIVRILDSFTEYMALLEKELKLRKIQYSYYRDKLLTFGDDVEYKTLHELCFIVDYRGKTPEKTKEGIFLVTAKNIRKGYIDYECSKEYISKKDYNEVMHRGLPHKGDVLITTEAPLGNVAQIDNDKIALAQRVIKYRPKDNNLLLSEFLKYYLLSTGFQNKLLKASTGGTVKGIKGSKLHQLEIPVLPIEEQERIVKILDCFDNLCNNLTAGIPAEISARQKQYEYYRDKLLTFKEV